MIEQSMYSEITFSYDGVIDFESANIPFFKNFDGNNFRGLLHLNSKEI